MSNYLQTIQEFVTASNSTNSNTDKLNVLREYADNEDVQKALNHTYDTFKQYGVTSDNCKKNSNLIKYGYTNLFDLLRDLNARFLTGHEAISYINGFVEANKSHADLIFSILDRNLKTRSTASTINKVIPGLIPTFDVALANSYDEKMAKKVDWNDGWYLSRKLDGVRCICMINEEGDINFYSRAGKDFITLDALKPSIKKLGLSNMILDGEICMTDADGNEDFQGIIKEIKRKNHTIETPKFFIFDMLTMKEFTDKVSDTLFFERILNANNAITEDEFIQVLPQIEADDDNLASFMETVKEEGWEGLMLRKNTTYKGKRSKDVLKVKKFHDAEYIVVDIENAINRVIVDELEVEEMMMKNVVIEHKGNRVSVGSGFSHEQRRHYFLNPNDIVGKQICVQYFEETLNERGTNSLRFPTVKAVYETKRNF
jgi:DNA ligase-1